MPKLSRVRREYLQSLILTNYKLLSLNDKNLLVCPNCPVSGGSTCSLRMEMESRFFSGVPLEKDLV